MLVTCDCFRVVNEACVNGVERTVVVVGTLVVVVGALVVVVDALVVVMSFFAVAVL